MERRQLRATRQIDKRGIAVVVEKKTGTVGITERKICGTEHNRIDGWFRACS